MPVSPFDESSPRGLDDEVRRLGGRTLTRRGLLRWSAGSAFGAVALLLVGCNDDDDDDDATPTEEATEEPTEEATEQPTEEATEEPTEEAGGIAARGVTIVEVALAGEDAVVTIRNEGDAPASMEGWFVCNFPGYWPIPSTALAPGASLRIHAGSGEDGDEDVFAGGGFGSLSGADAGEVAIYNVGGNFGDPSAIVSYVGWNGGAARSGVAQEAGIWGDAFVDATDGATISLTGSGGGRPRGGAGPALRRARRSGGCRRLRSGARGLGAPGRSVQQCRRHPAGAPIDEIPVERWRELIDVNLTGSFIAARAAFGLMRHQDPRGGRIINNGSISAYVPRPGSVRLHGLTKHAITGLTRTLSLDGRANIDIACRPDRHRQCGDRPWRSRAWRTGMPQADGSIRAEPLMDVNHVAEAVVQMSEFPLERRTFSS